MEKEPRSILIVDDDLAIRRLIRATLSPRFNIREACDGFEALDSVAMNPVDLVLLDIEMPGIDGYETCERLKCPPKDECPQVIMVSGKSSNEEMARAFQVGADDFLLKPIDCVELFSRVELHFRLMDSESSTESLREQVDCHHRQLKQLANERIRDVMAIQDVAVFTLAKVAESRDNDTGNHIIRIREYAQVLARELRRSGPYMCEIDEQFLADLYRSAPLHDIGKVGIPDSILLKPGRLTKEEFEEMKRHAIIGGNILHEAVLQIEGGGFLAMAALIAQFHHERWDGKGYPAQLVADEIPLAARIVSVVDVFDALTSERPYKHAWAVEAAKAEIDKGKGTQFDPVIVDAFSKCMSEILIIKQRYRDQHPTTVGAMSFVEYDLAEA